MSKKILIILAIIVVTAIGYFGYNTNQLDGQTVKTRDLYRLISEQSETPVDFYDTEEFQYRKLSLLKMYLALILNILDYKTNQRNYSLSV